MKSFSKLSIIFILLFALMGCAKKQEIQLFNKLDSNYTVGDSGIEIESDIKTKSQIYKIKKGDRVKVIIYEHPELSSDENGIMVDENGYITLPAIGRVKVTGLSESQAARKIERKMRGYIAGVYAVVEVKNKKVYVLGEVNKPGIVDIDKDHIDLLRAIAKASGFKDTANKDAIYIVRQKNNKAKLFRVSLTNDNSLSNAFKTLQPEDIIYVAPNSIKYIDMGPMQTMKIISTAASPLVTVKALSNW